MRRRQRIVWVAAVVGALVAGCGQGGTDSPAEQTGKQQVDYTVDADGVVDATWQLGVLALRSGEGPNLVVSPSSLVVALAMLGEGAVGDESTPFDIALGASGQERADAVAVLLAALARYDGDPVAVQADTLPTVPVLHTAQRVVLDDDPGREPAQQFLDRITQGYGAGVLTTDLGSDKGTAALSAWVDENTGGLIKKTAITPDPDTAVVLQDAFVLAAAWQHPFSPALPASFSAVVPGKQPIPELVTVQVPTMHTEADLATVTSDGWQAVRLPYTADLSADLLLPPSRATCPPDDCPAWTETDPTMYQAHVLADLSNALDKAEPTHVSLWVPTLDLTTKTDLKPLLTGLGLDTGLTGVLANGKPVLVDQAVQQAVLKVDEEGTRAAAVTEVAMTMGAMPDPAEQIRFDRPFLLVIRDGTTGWPVLIAAITDPR
ncbi:MAG: serpin family protein [Micrococcales bacterium]|nr:serpin family protein [Micrococcales bacterium]